MTHIALGTCLRDITDATAPEQVIKSLVVVACCVIKQIDKDCVEPA